MSKPLMVKTFKMDNDLIAKLDALLEQQSANIDELYDLLKQENDSINKQNNDKLIDIAKNKNQLINDVNKTDLQISNFNNNKQLTANQAFKSKTNSIKMKLHDCQKINEINAQIISVKSASLNRLSQALKLQNDHLTYDQKGNTKSLLTISKDFEI